MSSNTKLSVWVLAAIVCAAALAADAQDVPPCASSLAACLPYMNATKPPHKCCIPLKLAIDTQFKCLCDLFQNPEALGVNVTDALTLPARCGISKDLSACGTSPSPTPAPAPAQSPGSSTTPAGVPPAPGTGDKKNGAGKIASAKGFFAAIIFWGLIKLY
ncbi:hypothetical protein QQ045_000959 [Rhodiola kirilowii]